MMQKHAILIASAASLAACSAVLAADHVWDSATLANWGDSSKWTGGVPSIPTPSADTITINTGSVEYDPAANGGDFRLNSAMTVAAGALFQQKLDHGAWMKLADGNNATASLVVNGTFIGPSVPANLYLGNGSNAVANVTVGTGAIFSTAASMIVSNGSTFGAAGASAVTIGGTLNLSGGSTFSAGGNVRVGNIIEASGGSISVTGTNAKLAVTNYALLNGTNLTVSGTGASVTIGGNLEITSATAWVKDGATLSTGGTFIQNAGSTLKITGGGSVSRTGDAVFETGRSFILQDSGSTFTTTGEFKPRSGSVSISGGTLNIALIAFDGDEGTLEFSGGQINISRGDFFDGIFSTGGARFVNFTENSTGVMYLQNGTQGSAEALINSQRIRFDTDLTGLQYFDIDPVEGGVQITAVPVPEPAMAGALMVGAGMLLMRRRCVLKPQRGDSR